MRYHVCDLLWLKLLQHTSSELLHLVGNYVLLMRGYVKEEYLSHQRVEEALHDALPVIHDGGLYS